METPALMLLNDDKIDHLLQEVITHYGYDFWDYSRASLSRRIRRFMVQKQISTIGELEKRLLENEFFFELFVEELTVNVTEMYRDPTFYQAVKKIVIPKLATYPSLKIWHAGCSTGEEVYSLAILLHEANLLERTVIYGTDINQKSLEQGRSGIFPLRYMDEYNQNYKESGGESDLKDYYKGQYSGALFHRFLRDKIIFSAHNLVSDQSFNEFNFIICRNVLIYFNKKLQNRVMKLFLNSLPVYGLLGLGSKESLTLSAYFQNFEPVVQEERIFRRIL
ncbi:MAG: CheR family methyltransferase [Bacteroidia bacterium]